MIIEPPWIVSILGCSLITIHTQKGPIIVSSKKNKLTSSAGINLGAIVTSTKGMATHIIHINGTIIKSVPTSEKLSTKIKAKIATTVTTSLKEIEPATVKNKSLRAKVPRKEIPVNSHALTL